MFDIYIYNKNIVEEGRYKVEKSKIFYSPLFRCFISYTGLCSPYIVYTISLGGFNSVKGVIKAVRKVFGYKKPPYPKKIIRGFHMRKESKLWGNPCG